MAISYIGSATGSTSATLPAHQAGDLIIVFAYRAGSTSTPSVPTSPAYTSIVSNTANSVVNAAQAAVVGYLIAASSSETSGTWSGASRIDCHVYRGTHPTAPIGRSTSVDVVGYSDSIVRYSGFTLSETSGSSWVAAFAGSVGTSTTGVVTAPTGMVNRSSNTTFNYLGGHDTNGGVSSWSLQTVALGGSNDWMSFCIELLAPTSVPVSVSVTGISGTGTVGSVTTAAKANVSPTGLAAASAVGGVETLGAALIDVTGEAATGAVGTVIITALVEVTGEAATSAVGTVTASAGASIAVTGEAATGAAGDVEVITAILVSGVAATGAVGTVSVTAIENVSVSVTGLSATSALGSVQAEAGTDVTVTGLSATGSIGSVSVYIGWSIIGTTQTPSWADTQT